MGRVSRGRIGNRFGQDAWTSHSTPIGLAMWACHEPELFMRPYRRLDFSRFRDLVIQPLDQSVENFDFLRSEAECTRILRCVTGGIAKPDQPAERAVIDGFGHAGKCTSRPSAAEEARASPDGRTPAWIPLRSSSAALRGPRRQAGRSAPRPSSSRASRPDSCLPSVRAVR